MPCLLRFLRDEGGPTAVEYAVMLALVIGVCIAGIGLFGTSANASFQNSATKLNATTGS